jgi:hypothetical protein
MALERETGIEPATNGLGSRYSTIELLPLDCPDCNASLAAVPWGAGWPQGGWLGELLCRGITLYAAYAPHLTGKRNLSYWKALTQFEVDPDDIGIPADTSRRYFLRCSAFRCMSIDEI